MNNIYKEKYIKYKEKYILLKKNIIKKKYNQQGGNFEIVSRINLTGDGDNRLINPSGLTELPNGDLAICDPGNNRIKIIDINGNFRYNFGSENSDGFNAPLGITLLRDGNLAICDSGNNRIQIRDISGNLINLFGSEGREKGQFKKPCGITQLSDGNLAICNEGKQSIEIFTPDGVSIKQIFIIDLNSAYDIIQLHNGDFVVTDNLTNKIFRITSGLYSLITRIIGRPGNEEGQFDYPLGVTELSDGNLAICDYFNSRIQIMNIENEFISKIDLKNPKNIIKLSNGNLAVLCNYYDIISRIRINEIVILKYDSMNYNLVLVSILEVIEIFKNYRNGLKNNPQKIDISYIEDPITKGMICDFFSFLKFSKNKSDLYDKIRNNNKKWFDENFKEAAEYNIFNTLFKEKNTLLSMYNQKILKPFFKFYDAEKQKYNQSIDAGGLTKTVFNLFSIEVANNFFDFDKETTFYTLKSSLGLNPNTRDSNTKKIFFIGQLFGFAILLGQLIKIKLNPFTLYQMVRDDFVSVDTNKIISILNEYDPNLINNHKYPFSCYNEDYFNEMCEYTRDEDENGMPVKTDNIPEETTKKIKEDYTSTEENLLKYFIDGFRSQINIKHFKLNRLNLKEFSELITGKEVLNYDTFISYLKFKNFNNDEQKDKIKNLIHSFAEKDPKYLEKLLEVITGATAIPVQGFPNDFHVEGSSGEYPLHFLLREYTDASSEFHTCFNQLIINKYVLDDYMLSSDPVQTELYSIFEPENLVKQINRYSTA
jgi:hypothetical protein